MDEMLAPSASTTTAGPSVLRSVVAGGVGGVVCTLVGMPFDLVKVRIQENASRGVAKSPLSIARAIVGSQGVSGFWRGALSPVLFAAPSFAIAFGSNDLNRQLVRGWRGRRAGEADSAADVGLAGCLVAFYTTPLYASSDRVKVLLQIDGRRIERGEPARYRNSSWDGPAVISLIKSLPLILK